MCVCVCVCVCVRVCVCVCDNIPRLMAIGIGLPFSTTSDLMIEKQELLNMIYITCNIITDGFEYVIDITTSILWQTLKIYHNKISA